MKCSVSMCEECFSKTHSASVSYYYYIIIIHICIYSLIYTYIFKLHPIGYVKESKGYTQKKCESHNRNAEVFCESCETVVCWMCPLNGDHKGNNLYFTIIIFRI